MSRYIGGSFKREEKELEKVATPGIKTIEEVQNFLQADIAKLIKTVAIKADGEPIFIFIPGDRDLNFAKLLPILQVPEHAIEMLGEEEIFEIAGAHHGVFGDS